MVPRAGVQAWLWRLAAVGLGGRAQTSARAPDAITLYEARALCLARTGLAVSSPAQLQVCTVNNKHTLFERKGWEGKVGFDGGDGRGNILFLYVSSSVDLM